MSPAIYNEMYTAEREVRPHYAPFAQWLAETPATRIAQNRQAADLLFHRVGITFAVYGEASGTERLIPFDIVPHVIPGPEWERLAPDIDLTVVQGAGSRAHRLKIHLRALRKQLGSDDFLTLVVSEVLESKGLLERVSRPGLHRLKAALLTAEMVERVVPLLGLLVEDHRMAL